MSDVEPRLETDRPPDGRARAWALRGAFAAAAVGALVGSVLAARAVFPGSGGHGHHAVTPGGTTLGEPTDVPEADRTIRILASDELRYSPATVRIDLGEVVAFEVTNDGAVPHEFFLADEVHQEAHETEMAHGGQHVMPDSPHAVSLAPGETKTIAWRFTQAGTTEFACHVPGHYAGGMIGSIVVS